ncbi:hypothetical protein CLI74_10670, partial [Porphyromonas gingivalis]
DDEVVLSLNFETHAVAKVCRCSHLGIIVFLMMTKGVGGGSRNTADPSGYRQSLLLRRQK